jgi:hypothetical protein
VIGAKGGWRLEWEGWIGDAGREGARVRGGEATVGEERQRQAGRRVWFVAVSKYSLGKSRGVWTSVAAAKSL